MWNRIWIFVPVFCEIFLFPEYLFLEYASLLVTDVGPNSESQSKSTQKDESKQSLHISKQTHEFVYWNWDKTATSEDPQVKLLDWPRLAASVS